VKCLTKLVKILASGAEPQPDSDKDHVHQNIDSGCEGLARINISYK
jgi:hypothetical protein